MLLMSQEIIRPLKSNATILVKLVIEDFECIKA